MLIVHALSQCHYPGVRTRPTLSQGSDDRLAVQCVADEDGIWNGHLVIAEIGDQRAERCVTDRDLDHQAEREYPIHEDMTEFLFASIFLVEVERLRIMGQRRDQEIVGLCHSPAQVVRDLIAFAPLVEIFTRHQVLASCASMRMSSAPSVT